MISKKVNISKIFDASIYLPASKSESNRALILQALGNFESTIHNISEANDTKILKKALLSKENTIDIEDAGTAMRFLLAYKVIKNEKCIIKGTNRMNERPIGILVDALQKLGANIIYIQKSGFPPIQILDFSYSGINNLEIDANISSQYISSLLLIGSQLPNGIILILKGQIASKPYIGLTLNMLQNFGISSKWENNTITIAPQKLLKTELVIENDWSAVGYWCNLVVLAENGRISISGLKKNSLQGDIKILDIYKNWGLSYKWENENLILTTSKNYQNEVIEIDFTDIPDQAQNIIVCCVAKKIKLRFCGVESLKIKETNRLSALNYELQKFGSGIVEVSKNTYETIPNFEFTTDTFINTYNDHRMAMSLATLGILGPVNIENPNCVKKSYPNFWDELNKLAKNKKGK